MPPRIPSRIPPRILYLATADARGHLMRAQLLAHALHAAGARVQVITTSEEGRRFLAEFGIDAPVLSRHYAVQFDTAQNMLRRETDRNVAHYVFLPNRMLRDMARLHGLMRGADLVVNDSFHPALLAMGVLPGWRRKVVHVYGASLRAALESNFSGRLPAWMAGLFRRAVSWQVESAYARIEHDFAYRQAEAYAHNSYRLPTPVAVVNAGSGSGPAPGAAMPCSAVSAPLPQHASRAAVYMNPHFRDPGLADALQAGMAGAGVSAHCVGEGYAGRPGWIGRDAHWVETAVRSDLIVSAPGMAALSIALVYNKPIVLVLTDQPEQTVNAARAAELGLRHRVVVWRDDAVIFKDQVAQAAQDLLAPGGAQRPALETHAHAAARMDAWVDVLRDLARSRSHIPIS